MVQANMELNKVSILIDYCSMCKSYWFDKGELTKIIKDRELKKCLSQSKDLDRDSRFPCPRCNEKLKVKIINEIEIDICRGCKGIWCDRDEIFLIQKKMDKDSIENKLLKVISRL
ncbi:MAG: zf-TFIIB domain-containing protein [Thermoplasmata archaeon]|nr:zf-TFIIB domain-containing protein [Thermoplasmata archaeon]